ncbi:hypothetical protein MIND_00250400 [Mycena indigotica]|uniref:Uncharacterized protein n=1 Tax=Mycena indigotica TaxID=2126181 RepID=A0A8H6T8W6_9AGAR|nr:uncharacterized protein MIND_00250400 [Mycena indigotica]KAF7312371.1 hypothetical protein MIND_00250400 [Mycena indigotica]
MDNSGMSQMFPGDTLAEEKTSLRLLAVFNFLQIFGFMVVLITIIVAWMSPGVHRTRVWYSFMLSWLFYCLSYFMLAGGQVGPEPAFSVCLVQAALIYSGPVLISSATLSLILYMYLTLSFVLRNGTPTSKRHTTMIQVYPYIAWALRFIVALSIGLSHQSFVARDTTGFYCHFTNAVQATISAVIALITVLIMIFLEVRIAILLSRNWVAFRKFHPNSQSGISLPLIIRLCIFTIMSIVGLGLTALSFLPQSTVDEGKTHLAAAIIPCFAGFIFGTQKDTFKALMFWRPSIAEDKPTAKAGNSATV